MTASRVCQVGKRSSSQKEVQVAVGIGSFVLLREAGEMVLVEDGLKGEVVAGVRSPLRCVLMVSSRVLRERRRKSRSARGWKQNEGVRGGGEGGRDIVIEAGLRRSGGGGCAGETEGGVEGDDAGGRAQNQDARLSI